MRMRPVITRLLDVLIVLAAGMLAYRVLSGENRIPPLDISAKRISRIVMVVLGLMAVRVVV